MPAIPPTGDFNKSTIDKDTFHAKFLAVHAYLTGLLGSDGLPSTALGALGVSAFIKTLLPAVDAAAARDKLGAAPAVAEVSFRAYQSTTQAVAATTFTKVLFQTESYDIGGNFADSEFTAPAAGIYLFTANVGADLVDGQRLVLSAYINGAQADQFFDFTAGGASAAVASAPVLLKLAAADVVAIYVYSSAAEDTRTGTRFTYFAGIRIG